MFEKLSQIAEQAATNCSRRQFLGQMGRGALVVSAAIGGLLALPAVTQAGRQPRLCVEGSAAGCVGVLEGYPCSAERAPGKCVGPKGGRWTPTTICGCSGMSPR
jgi:hypothetical protein